MMLKDELYTLYATIKRQIADVCYYYVFKKKLNKNEVHVHFLNLLAIFVKKKKKNKKKSVIRFVVHIHF